ncbi:MAG TPA: hypothetical protein VII38_19990 [Polyangia bacterium]
MQPEGTIVVGSPQVEPSTSSHSPGVREGNARANLFKERGMEKRGPFMVFAHARRSTGINPKAHAPIDPRMPHLTPA